MRFSVLSPVLACAVCLLVAGACTTLRPIAPEELTGPNPPDSVRVTMADHSTVVLHTPKVVGDTLVGTVNGARQAIPLLRTIAIGERRAAPERTAGLAFGAVTAAVVTLLFIATERPTPTAPQGVCTLNGPFC